MKKIVIYKVGDIVKFNIDGDFESPTGKLRLSIGSITQIVDTGDHDYPMYLIEEMESHTREVSGCCFADELYGILGKHTIDEMAEV